MKAKFVDYMTLQKKLLIAHYQKRKGVLSGFLQESDLGLVSGSIFISNLHNWTEDMLKSADDQELTLQVCWVTGLELNFILSN